VNLSNQLTLARILLSALVVIALQRPTLFGRLSALGLFVLAALTDYWDGWVARRRGEMSALGALLDPVADKCLLLGAFWSFVTLHVVPLWMVIVITAREVAVTAMRAAILPHRAIPAMRSGKQKTVSQIITAVVILLLLVVETWVQQTRPDLALVERPPVRLLVWALMLWTTAMTVFSGVHLLMRVRR